ncbi:hypothetical protein OAN75_06920 [Amylibacter sp.]|nr:hypothetical protein [Amylibacter sp.]
MITHNILSKSILIKVIAFAFGACFTFISPLILGNAYSELIKYFSLIAVASAGISIGSAGTISRNFDLVKKNDAIDWFVVSILKRKLLVYLVMITICIFYKLWFIGVLAVIVDISIIGSLLLYADEQYIKKQLYILFQSAAKLLFLLIARVDLVIFLFLFYTIPRFYLLKVVANNLLLGGRKYKSDFKIDGLVKNEKSVYLSNLFQEIFLYLPILMSGFRAFEDFNLLAWSFCFALSLAFYYGVISTINDLILPSLIKQRADKVFLKSAFQRYIISSILYLFFALVTVTSLVSFSPDLLQLKFDRNLFAGMCIYHFFVANTNFFRQILIALDRSNIHVVLLLIWLIVTGCLFFLLDAYWIIILIISLLSLFIVMLRLIWQMESRY